MLSIPPLQAPRCSIQESARSATWQVSNESGQGSFSRSWLAGLSMLAIMPRGFFAKAKQAVPTPQASFSPTTASSVSPCKQ